MPGGRPFHVLIVGIGGVTPDFAPNWPEPVLGRALAQRKNLVSALGYFQPDHPSMNERRQLLSGVVAIRIPAQIWPTPDVARVLRTIPEPNVMHIFHMRNVFIYNAVAWARENNVPIVMSPVGPFHDDYLVENRERPYAGGIHYERLAYTLPGMLRQLLRDPRPRRQLTNYLLHAPLRQIDRFIASSRHELGILGRMGIPPERCDFVPLWIGPPSKHAPDDSILAGLGRPIVLFIGQLTPRKGFDLLVEAMPAVVARHPEVCFVFASHNPASQAEMEQRAQELGVANNLRFVGRVSEGQKLALLGAATCIALPSRYEGFGLPLLEAMQAGVPLVASNIPVIDEIVSDGVDGLLVEPEQPAALAAGILRLLEDAELRERLIAAGREKLIRDFDEEQLLARLKTNYLAAGETRKSGAKAWRPRKAEDRG